VQGPGSPAFRVRPNVSRATAPRADGFVNFTWGESFARRSTLDLLRVVDVPQTMSRWHLVRNLLSAVVRACRWGAGAGTGSAF
jgi:hypothetical protein